MPEWRASKQHVARKYHTCGTCKAPIRIGQKYWRHNFKARDSELRNLSDEEAEVFPVWTAAYTCRFCELRKYHSHAALEMLYERYQAAVEDNTVEDELFTLDETEIIEELLAIHKELNARS